VFQLLLADVLEGKIELADSISAHASRYADAAGFGQPFKPGRYVHRIPEDVVILDHHVALVNADAELDALVRSRRRISLRHAGLHLGRTAHGIDHASKFRQQSVAGILDDAAMMLADLRIDQIGKMRFQTLM